MIDRVYPSVKLSSCPRLTRASSFWDIEEDGQIKSGHDEKLDGD
jgi:hypothetical protein